MAHAFEICCDAGASESLEWSRAVPEGLRQIEQMLGIEAARAALVQVYCICPCYCCCPAVGVFSATGGTTLVLFGLTGTLYC